MSTIKLTPHAYPQNVQATADILKRGEWHLWDCPEADNYMRQPIPNDSHPHYALWSEWQTLLRSGAVERGEAWIDFDGGKTELCEWRADQEYKIVRKQKKRLIDWRKMPKGVMTNVGALEKQVSSTESWAFIMHQEDDDAPPRIVLEPNRRLRLAPSGTQPWILWKGGECPVPEGAIVDAECRGGFNLVDTGTSFRWQHSRHQNDIIAYRVTGLAQGWTDNPEVAE